MAEERPAKWGLVIDLDRCTGCNACIAACSMENNVPFVGEDEVAYGRALYWIRTQRYWEGEYPAVAPTFQPVMCQQCGNAPCEPVCPVYASVHSEEEQINLAVYNRCVGTRYCANNCPYFARVFNWFDYELPEPMRSYLNPDVTVRRRGVMEKCTFCVQRIVHGRQKARAEGRELRDGEVQPACVQACPAEALVFGDLSDPESRVSQMARNQRRYHLLEELGTLPRVTYLKGVGNHGG
ncbi:4Fe-4S dicluster domain-containing protein [Thermanaerothrix sp. 4228-RoL]|uniref:4Fe-4S dicluster domain-containing protein n=1 Tax=Thermanaerothrix solaris TaxID=3058434 RepID=A0ABU3NPU1_9CHLR|nr:4Fe-4S dicluster domain-containing protein [Thermanaerothrix sp. 4228-RoL]MDT8898218.1 4Fe-4S dicluster domain-containing protein [Thermanaerothrix sp. 4228-RoL]